MPPDLGAPLMVMARAKEIAADGSCSSTEEIMAQLLKEGAISNLRPLFTLPQAIELRRVMGVPLEG